MSYVRTHSSGFFKCSYFLSKCNKRQLNAPVIAVIRLDLLDGCTHGWDMVEPGVDLSPGKGMQLVRSLRKQRPNHPCSYFSPHHAGYIFNESSNSCVRVNQSNTHHLIWALDFQTIEQGTVERVFFQTSVVCLCYCFSGWNGQDTLLWQAWIF